MLVRCAVAGAAVLFGVSVWALARAGDHPPAAPPAERAEAVVTAADDGGTARDDAAYRFRNSQSRHWRHVMIGGR